MNVKRLGNMRCFDRRLVGMVVVTLGFVLAWPVSGDARRSGSTESLIRYGRTASGYVFMNGGRTASERADLESRSSTYNVKMILVPPKGFPLSQLIVFIANNKVGRIDKVPLSGSVLYFQLPAGSYTFGARIRRQIFLIRDIRVHNAGRQTYVLRADIPSAWPTDSRPRSR